MHAIYDSVEGESTSRSEARTRREVIVVPGGSPDEFNQILEEVVEREMYGNEFLRLFLYPLASILTGLRSSFALKWDTIE